MVSQDFAVWKTEVHYPANVILKFRWMSVLIHTSTVSKQVVKGAISHDRIMQTMQCGLIGLHEMFVTV